MNPFRATDSEALLEPAGVETEGEDAVQREFHGAGDDWRERAAAELPMGRLGRPEDAAALVVLLLSERSGVVTGSVIDWDQQVPGGSD